ncbi:MAG: sterol desaturase family protein [Micavibrio aeruginosavorus]|uniref:Sterol desaturase family protein n=1 Tax=Micavibrio aeruginosavorus TaxID=349221 RepID=A0A7T5R3L9_9BACT|nr:MAG: sterol desaturase family protein [Micavibrio aeruginosavorus]
MNPAPARIRYLMSCLSWPVIFLTAVIITAIGFGAGAPVLGFNIAYLMLALSLYILEQVMPHEREWNEDDGQTFASLAHTLTSKGTVQTLFIFSAALGLSSFISPAAESGYGLWPRDWPLIAQVALGLSAAELGLYWGHRLAHEWPVLWRFHAIHHSVVRLWILNTGRFHFIDSLKSILMAMGILMVLGAPMEVFHWVAAITAFIGMLTHCNVEMRFGPLSYIFNTPGLHRWHHSRDLREGNKNYGENLVLWDLLFGTFFNENRRPPVNIGIGEYMPPGFLQQLVWPFQVWFSRSRAQGENVNYEALSSRNQVAE